MYHRNGQETTNHKVFYAIKQIKFNKTSGPDYQPKPCKYPDFKIYRTGNTPNEWLLSTFPISQRESVLKNNSQ